MNNIKLSEVITKTDSCFPIKKFFGCDVFIVYGKKGIKYKDIEKVDKVAIFEEAVFIYKEEESHDLEESFEDVYGVSIQVGTICYNIVFHEKEIRVYIGD